MSSRHHKFQPFPFHFETLHNNAQGFLCYFSAVTIRHKICGCCFVTFAQLHSLVIEDDTRTQLDIFMKYVIVQ